MDDEVAFTSFAALAPAIARQAISPVELTELMLRRIERYNGHLNAFITVVADQARRDAKTAETEIRSGTYKGPLHGIPVAVKDLYATKGVVTTFGSPLFADWIPDHDAAAVERLRRAGAVILGKTNLHELAYGTTSANAHYGAVQNPWQRGYHPGGSSGGSAAAVAAGLAYMALGSDTGASIRQPASCCHLAGIKPTFGRASKHGCLPLAWSMDHVGPLARTVEDAALALNMLSGYDPRDPTSVERPVPDFAAGLRAGVKGRRLALVRSFFFDDVEPQVASAVEAAARQLEELGAKIEEIDLPDMAALYSIGTLTIAVEGATFHAAHLRDQPEKFSDELRAAFELGGFYKATDYVQAQRLRRHLTEQTATAMAPFDALLIPTAPILPTPIQDNPPHHAVLRPRNTLPFNVLGLPAISVGAGFSADGLPIGLQIVGRPFDEQGILQLAHAFEQAAVWHHRHPPSVGA